MNYESINLLDKLSKVAELWSPHVVAELNDYQFKVARIQGEFTWHSHPDTDEAFIVLDGSIVIKLRDGEVTLKTGELYVVPRGVEHKPVAESEAQILLIEPRGVVNTGDAKSSALTAQTDQWL